MKEWEEDLNNSPIGTFSFSGHTPPFSNLDIEQLSVKSSRRQDAVTVYADIDRFTAYVTKIIATDATSSTLSARLRPPQRTGRRAPR